MILQTIDKLIIELGTILDIQNYIQTKPNINLISKKIFKKSKKVLKRPEVQDDIVDAATGLVGD
jgi:hypothetical protein